jgi:RNA polymerase sigma-70 factor (ECF subfamily)
MKSRGTVKTDLDQSPEETELSRRMKLSQAGDAESYLILLKRVHAMLAKYVASTFRRFGGSHSGAQEDVLQEILLAIHVKRHTYDPNQYFLPWLYAIARYKIIDFFRKNKVLLRSTVSLEDELENLETVMSFDVSVEIDILKLCESLPEKQKTVLNLVKLQGLSVEEAAKKTGYSPSDIKVTVHRAIHALREKIREDLHEN